jgi:glycosyltransferase involved in cell wall biosynthesis
MIVKNEAPVIRRCLNSVLPVIDHWVIVDTGSSDGTQAVIREHLKDRPGELIERPWRDFASNRTEALALARGHGDYTLVMDADDVLTNATAGMPALEADSYTLEIIDADIVYRRPQVVRSAMPFRYEGVLHEYLTCDAAGPSGHLEGLRILRNNDGARRRDPATYRRDAELLESALLTESNPSLAARYRFYLAQSYHDCGEYRLALENYRLRAGLGHWIQEVFVSLYRVAQEMERLEHPRGDVIAAYLRAADLLPTRLEALHGAARYCRLHQRYEQGYKIAARGLGIGAPEDALFLEKWIYDVGLLDEYAINAYWAGHYRESLDASLKILESGIPAGAELQRIAANARFAFHKLGTPQRVNRPPSVGPNRSGGRESP